MDEVILAIPMEECLERFCSPTVFMLVFRGTEYKWFVCLFKSFFFLFLAFHLLYSKTGHYMARTGLELSILLSQPPGCRDYKCALPHLASFTFSDPPPPPHTIAFVIPGFSSLSSDSCCSIETKWTEQNTGEGRRALAGRVHFRIYYTTPSTSVKCWSPTVLFHCSSKELLNVWELKLAHLKLMRQLLPSICLGKWKLMMVHSCFEWNPPNPPYVGSECYMKIE